MVWRKVEYRSLVQSKIKLKENKHLCNQTHLGNPLKENQHFQAVECYKTPVKLSEQEIAINKFNKHTSKFIVKHIHNEKV